VNIYHRGEKNSLEARLQASGYGVVSSQETAEPMTVSQSASYIASIAGLYIQIHKLSSIIEESFLWQALCHSL